MFILISRVNPVNDYIALPKKSKQSAKGAAYESRGQVPSKARHVALAAICTIK
jgi:hypothetical protein